MRYDRYKTIDENSESNTVDKIDVITLVKMHERLVASVEEIISFYGAKNQKAKAIEELEELIAAICEEDKNHIAEEIADVEIMTTQLRLLYGISGFEINEIKDFKIKRQLERIQIEKERKELLKQ